MWNRSHYEEVLVVRVHPSYLDGQRLDRFSKYEASSTVMYAYALAKAVEGTDPTEIVSLRLWRYFHPWGLSRERT